MRMSDAETKDEEVISSFYLHFLVIAAGCAARSKHFESLSTVGTLTQLVLRCVAHRYSVQLTVILPGRSFLRQA